MKILHTSDWHLGFVRYSRVAKCGVNQRTVDVERAVSLLVDSAIELRPDVLVIAGDVFHEARPSNRSIVFACDQVERLTDEGIIVAICGGNHDRSKIRTNGQILPVLRRVGAFVADERAERWTFDIRGQKLSVLAVPEHVAKATEFTPDPESDRNLLLLHAAMQGTIPGDDHLRLDQLNAGAWDYVALGDYHCMKELAPNAFYSGAVDFTTTDVFGELTSGPKGFILRDLATGAHEFHELPLVRRFIHLEPLYCAGMTPEAVDAELRQRLEGVEIEGAVVRVVLHDLSREVQHALDTRRHRRWRARALNFAIDYKRPERVEVIAPRLRRQPIEEMFADRLIRNIAGAGFTPEEEQQMITMAKDVMAEAGEKLARTEGGIEKEEAA